MRQAAHTPRSRNMPATNILIDSEGWVVTDTGPAPAWYLAQAVPGCNGNPGAAERQYWWAKERWDEQRHHATHPQLGDSVGVGISPDAAKADLLNWFRNADR
jgi:hypothetical protein